MLLGLLAELGDSAMRARRPSAVLEGDHPFEVRAAALDVLARHGDDRIGGEAPGPCTRKRRRSRATARATSSWPGRRRPAPSSDGWTAGRSPRRRCRSSSSGSVALHGDPALDALVRKHWGSVRAGTAEEKLAEIRRLAQRPACRAGRPRTAARRCSGKHCAACHKLFGEGGEVGPDLTGVARDDTTALLANIVDPGAVIRAPYLQYAAVTTERSGRHRRPRRSGRGGRRRSSTPRAGGRPLRRDEIEELRELPTSIMPEDLLKPLGPQEVRDLFRYLQRLGPRGRDRSTERMCLSMRQASNRCWLLWVACRTGSLRPGARAQEVDAPRVYENRLEPLADPRPLLADYPEFVEPVREVAPVRGAGPRR